MRRFAIAAIAVGGLAVCAAAQARPEFVETLKQTYPQATAAIDKRPDGGCGMCHTDSPPDFNPYGKQLKDTMKAASSKALTPAILHSIDAQDADADGANNGAELAAGTNPGDAKEVPPKTATPAAPAATNGAPTPQPPAPAPGGHTTPAAPKTPAAGHGAPPSSGGATPATPSGASKPAAPAPTPAGAASSTTTTTSTTATPSTPPSATTPSTPSGTAAPPSATAAATTAATATAPPSASSEQPANPEERSFIPKNGFHPAIVHFPIALFIAGVLLDLIGYFRKSRELLLAGWYNLVLAAISTLAALATGTIALVLQGYPMKGTMLYHFCLGLFSTLCMWMMVSLRVHRHEDMPKPNRLLYYVLAAACFVAIGWAGHLGGNLVYGD